MCAGAGTAPGARYLVPHPWKWNEDARRRSRHVTFRALCRRFLDVTWRIARRDVPSPSRSGAAEPRVNLASSLRLGLGLADRSPGCLAVPYAFLAGCSGIPTGWVPAGGRSRLSKSASGMGRSKPTALWVIDSERATAWSAWMRPSLRAAVETRVWQRQSMEWMAAVLAAEPTAMPRSMSRRLQTGPVNSSSVDWLRRVLVWWRNSAQVAYPQAPQS